MSSKTRSSSKSSSKDKKKMIPEDAMDTSDVSKGKSPDHVGEMSKERSASPVVSEQLDTDDLHPYMVWKITAMATSKLTLRRPPDSKPRLLPMEPPVDPYKDVSLPSEAQSFLDNPNKRHEQCDVLLVAGNKKIPCHMALLSSYSKLFREKFIGRVPKKSTDMYRENITLPEPSVLTQVVDLLYTGCENVTLEMAMQLLPASSLMQLDYLSSKCVQVLKGTLTPVTCLDLKFLAISAANIALSQAVDYVWHLNFEAILNSDEFVQLPVERMVQLIEKENLYLPPPNVEFLVESWLSHKGRRLNAAVFIQLETMKYFRDVKRNELSIFDKKPLEKLLESSETLVPGWVYLTSIITPKNANHSATALTKRGEAIKVKIIEGVDVATPGSGSKRKRTSEEDSESKILGKRKIADTETLLESPVLNKIPKREITLISVETQTDFVPEVKAEPVTPSITPTPTVGHGSFDPRNSNRSNNFTPTPAPSVSGGGGEDWDDSSSTYTGVTAPPPSDNSGGDFGRKSYGDRGGRGGFRNNDRDNNFGGEQGGGRGGRGGRGGFGGNRYGNDAGGDNEDASGGNDRFGGGGGRFGGRGGGGNDRFGGGGGGGNDRFGGGGGGGNDRYGGGGGGGNDRFGGGGGGGNDRFGGGAGGNDRFGGGAGGNDRFGGGAGGNDRFGGGGNNDRFGGGDRGGGRGGRGGGRGGFNRDGGGGFGNRDIAPAQVAADEDWDNPGSSSSTAAPSSAPAISRDRSGGGFGGNSSFGGRSTGSSWDEGSSGGDQGGGFGRGGGRGGRGGRGGFGGNRFGDDNDGGGGGGYGGGNRFGGGGDSGGFGRGRGGGGGGGYGGGGGRNNGDDESNDTGAGGESRFGGGRGGRGGFGGRNSFGGGDNNNDQGGGGGGFGGGRGGGRGFDRGGRGGGRGGRGGGGGGGSAEPCANVAADEDWG